MIYFVLGIMSTINMVSSIIIFFLFKNYRKKSSHFNEFFEIKFNEKDFEK